MLRLLFLDLSQTHIMLVTHTTLLCYTCRLAPCNLLCLHEPLGFVQHTIQMHKREHNCSSALDSWVEHS